MTTSQGNLAQMSRFIFRAPRWYTSLGFAALIAALTGVAVFDDGYLLADAWEGLFFIGIPTVVASLATTGIDRWLGGRMTPNRSSLLGLTCELVVVAILLVAGIVALVTNLGQNFVFDAMLVGLASIFALRLIVLMAISRQRPLVAAVPASIQTVVAAVLLFVYSGTLRYLSVGGPLLERALGAFVANPRAYLARPEEAPDVLTALSPGDFHILGLLSLIYGTAAVVLAISVDRPWRRNLGVSGLDFLAGFVSHIAEGSNELEDFFKELGEDALVPVTVLSFRREDGSEKARFLLPMIHPGPMGEIGGGNLGKHVAGQAEGLAFPPHATAGHDFNLVSEREVYAILEAADRAMDRMEYVDGASESVRVREGDASMLGQAIGEDLLLVGTFAPKFADDVDYAVGLSAMAEARSGGFEDVLLVDAHNSNNGLEGEDLGHVVPGSERSFDMIQAAGVAAAGLDDAERRPMELGTAWDETDWEPREGIGPLGIRVATLSVGDQTTAYVLIDGNNMEPGLRETLREACGDHVEECEVMTSDTHIVNTVESENQVGAAIEDDALVELVVSLLEEALEDREPVEAGMASERAEVTVFGNDRTESLATHANAVVSMGSALAGAVIVTTLTLSIVIFLLTP